MDDAFDRDIKRITESRRDFVKKAAAGTLFAALGGYYLFDDSLTSEARAQRLPDGRPRLPPGQRVLSSLRPMGGEAGDARLSAFRLRVHGDVERPFSVTFAELLAMPQVEPRVDVHCVTGWSVLGARVKGVRFSELARRAGVRPTARFVVFEAAHGYTANTPIRDALAPDAIVAHALDGSPLARTHGGPARGIVPSLYFWKSAKWITGVRFVARDEPGYWETRGYHNVGDPWREQRYG